MGGEIGVESTPGEGSRFWFEVPMQLSSERRRSVRSMPPELKDLRVLVVDDSRTVRQVTARYLDAFGFRHEEAAAGEEALTLLRENADSPDEAFGLVLMDWKMPDMDGIRCSAEIRRMEFPHVTPRILMVSSYSREELGGLLDNRSIDAFLSKPINPSLLYEGILVAFGLRAAIGRGQAGAAEADAARGLQGLHILVVEDHPLNQQIAREVLEGAGIKVEIAGNGQEGVKRIENDSFDLVLMDVQMPIMDGLEATRHIRKQDRFAHLPIIAMTANAMDRDRELTRDAGMDAHVAKPINVFELFGAIRRLSGRKIEHEEAAEDGDTTMALWPGQEEAAQLPQIEKLDARTGLRRAQGDGARYRRLLQMFVSTEADALQRIGSAIADEDEDTARRHAHSLKGVAATVGADELARTAADCEHLIREGQWNEAAGDKLKLAWEAVVPAVQDWLNDTETGEVGGPAGDVQAAEDHPQRGTGELIEVLSRQIEQDDTAASDTVDLLSKAMIDHDARGRIPPLRRALQAYDFDAARTALASLRRGVEQASVD